MSQLTGTCFSKACASKDANNVIIHPKRQFAVETIEQPERMLKRKTKVAKEKCPNCGGNISLVVSAKNDA